LIPFRSQPPAPSLRQGYRLLENPGLTAEALNNLLIQTGDKPRSAASWQRVLERSTWYYAVVKDVVSEVAGEPDRLVGFVRITSDMALNANLWDLSADNTDATQAEIYLALVTAALGKLKRELGGCSISLAAPPAALQALKHHGFVLDPGGIRAMGLALQ
jgi:hypothetical protein